MAGELLERPLLYVEWFAGRIGISVSHMTVTFCHAQKQSFASDILVKSQSIVWTLRL